MFDDIVDKLTVRETLMMRGWNMEKVRFLGAMSNPVMAKSVGNNDVTYKYSFNLWKTYG